MSQEKPTTGFSVRNPQQSRPLFKLGLASSVTLVLSVAILGVAVTVFILWLIVGRPRLSQLGVIDLSTAFDSLKLAGGLVVGAGAAVALVVAYRKQRVGEAEHRRGEGAAERDETRLYNERFSKAADQLGSDRPAIRIAGIYALAGLADDWHAGRQTCIDVLCAYLRMPHTPRQKLAPPQHVARARTRQWEVYAFSTNEPHERPMSYSIEEEQVRETVLRVLREHLHEGADSSWAGAHLDFTGAVFEDASFDGIDFSDCAVSFEDCLFVGECGFSETIWHNSSASFLGAHVAGRLGFEYSTIADSDINLYAELADGACLTLQGVELESGHLQLLGPRSASGSVSFVDATLSGGKIDIHGPHLSGDASLAFSRSTFSGTDLTIEGGTYDGGNIWFNGATVEAGSIIFSAPRWHHGLIALRGTELAFDGVLLTGGTVALDDVHVLNSIVHFNEIAMTGGLLRLSSCKFVGAGPEFQNPTFSGGTVQLAEDSIKGDASALAKALRAAGAKVVVSR